MRQPNIVVVLTDQQRPDTCGVYGQQLPVTPVLDRVAAAGTVFEKAFTVQPVCGPSRAAIQTGRMPTSIGCWRNGLALPAGEPTLAGRLHDLGYATGYVGKWHLASDRGPRLPRNRHVAHFERRAVPVERRGGYRDAWVAADALELTSGPWSGRVWDEHGEAVELQGFRVDAVTDLAVDRLRKLAGDPAGRPFLLFVSHLEPHHQNDRFRTIGPPEPRDRFRGGAVPGDLAGTLGDWRWNWADYLACCNRIDTGLGRLLDELETMGIRDDTVVVFTSDHGSHFRTRNAEYKRTCHDASVHVPLVVAGPGFTGGSRCAELVCNLDLLPTLVRAAGGVDPGLDGLALHDVVDGHARRDGVLIQLSEAQVGRALRTERYTYAVRARTRPFGGQLHDHADEYVESHLYDNEMDPHQRRNLVADPATAPLRAALAERLLGQIDRLEGRRPRLRPLARSVR